MKAISKLKNFLQVDYFCKNFLVPAALLAFYCGSFAFITPRFFTRGVNFYFTRRLWDYVLIALAIGCLAAFILFVTRKDKPHFNKSIPRVRLSDLVFLLLPMTAITQYLLSNRSIISLKDFGLIVIFFVVFSGIYIIVVPALLAPIGSTRVLMATGLTFSITIVNMAMLSRDYNWLKEGNLGIQVLYLGAVFLIAWLLLGLKNRSTASFMVLAYFLVNGSIQLASPRTDQKEQSFRADVHPVLELVSERKPAVERNIYLLVYDSYVVEETMESYGIDNRSQEKFLSDAGFVIYPHTYTVGDDTVASMSRVLNASTKFYGKNRRGVSGDGIVQNALKNLGYETYGVFTSDYMFRGIGSSYDISIPKNIVNDASTLLTTAILTGEFQFDLGIEFDTQSHNQYVEQKQKILAGASRKPVFVYSHSDLPDHSQNSGICLANETKLYEDRLKMANAEMRRDIATVTAHDPQAIIIVAGDHGPYLTKNCHITSEDYSISEISREDIQDRFGSFLAIRWPTEAYTAYDDITVLQDVFLAVFAYLYEDPQILDLKITPNLVNTEAISGASVSNGIIIGGIDDGEPLFLRNR